MQQVTWSSPTTDRLLLEAGFGTFISKWGPQDTPGNPTKDMIRMNEQCAGGCAANGNIPNLTYRSMNWAVGWAGTFTWRASMSYVTGAHNMKFGYNGGHLVDNFENFTNSQNLLYRVNNGVPNQHHADDAAVTRRCRTSTSPRSTGRSSGRGDAMTLQGALRYERVWGYFPAQTIGRIELSARADHVRADRRRARIQQPHARAVALAFDLFGDRKTSLKVNVGPVRRPGQQHERQLLVAEPDRACGDDGQPRMDRC